MDFLFTGHSLDILARVPLWKDGLDYRHGTGHGIGSFLNVHEGGKNFYRLKMISHFLLSISCDQSNDFLVYFQQDPI